MQSLADIVETTRFPLSDAEFRNSCRESMDRDGSLVLHDFLTGTALESIREEGRAQKHLAYYTIDQHTPYLSPPDPAFPPDHPRNRLVESSKGCITTDQVPEGSALHSLYDSDEFRAFLCAVLGEAALHEYADTLSSINLHYASDGQELGWHFDNSSFAITLLVQAPEDGGEFQFVRDVRDADAGEMGYDAVQRVLDGNETVNHLELREGSLVLFRGRNSMHRVTPVAGKRTRMLAVLAYNSEPGIALAESAQLTFFGRTG